MTELKENPIISIEANQKYTEFWQVEIKVLLPPDPLNHSNRKEIILTNDEYPHGKKEVMHKVELLREAFGIEIKMVKSSLPPKVLINEFPQEIV